MIFMIKTMPMSRKHFVNVLINSMNIKKLRVVYIINATLNFLIFKTYIISILCYKIDFKVFQVYIQYDI